MRIFNCLIEDMRDASRSNPAQFLNEFKRYTGDLQRTMCEVSVDYSLDAQEQLIKRYHLGDTIPARKNKDLIAWALKKLPDFEITRACKEAIAQELNGSFRLSYVLSTWSYEMGKLYNRLPFTDEQRQQVTEFSIKVVQLVESVYVWADYSDWKLKRELWPEWQKALTRFRPGIYTEFGMIVSMGKLDFDTCKYPVISTSYVTESHNKMYLFESEKDYAGCRRIGWYFRPSMNDVAGMDPTDTSSACGQSFSRYDKYEAVMKKCMFVSDKEWIMHTFPQFLGCYAPQHLLDSGTYNEILLYGNTEPDGVVILRDEWEYESSPYKKKALEVVKERDVPIVIYDCFNNTVECTLL